MPETTVRLNVAVNDHLQLTPATGFVHMLLGGERDHRERNADYAS